MDESNAMKDLNSRIKQLTKLILTSQTVEEASRPGSPVKVDFDMSPYEVRSPFTNFPQPSEINDEMRLSPASTRTPFRSS